MKTSTFLICCISALILRENLYKGDFELPDTDSLIPFVFSLSTNRTSILYFLAFLCLFPLIWLMVILYFFHRNQSPNIYLNRLKHHSFYSTVALIVIYLLDLARDKLVEKETTGFASTQMFKYIFHFILTPILFVDSILSIEVDRRKLINEVEYPPKLILANTILVICYLLYAFFVIIYQGCWFNDFPNYIANNFDSFSANFEILLSEIIWSCFTALFFGLVDYWTL